MTIRMEGDTVWIQAWKGSDTCGRVLMNYGELPSHEPFGKEGRPQDLCPGDSKQVAAAAGRVARRPGGLSAPATCISTWKRCGAAHCHDVSLWHTDSELVHDEQNKDMCGAVVCAIL